MTVVVEIAQILSLPNLEQETIQAVNLYIRENLKPGLPPSMTKEDLLGVVGEWFNGPGGGET